MSSTPLDTHEPTLRLSVPAEGTAPAVSSSAFPRSTTSTDSSLPLRTWSFARPETCLRSIATGASPRSGCSPSLAAMGRLLALAAVDEVTGEIIGGGTLHHLDAERSIVEIGYFVLPHARGRGVATTIARMLAEHAFSLGIHRVAAYVNVGNVASERVAERAGFTREGVVRSMPVPDGRRVDKTLFSLLPGE